METGKLPLVILMAVACCSIGRVVLADIDISQINVNDLRGQLPPEFAKTNLTLEDVKKLIKDKCIQAAGDENGAEAYQEIESETLVLVECVTDIINMTAIQAEIEEASPRGEVEVVFNKYCNKRPQALECIESFNAKLVPCLDKDEQENQDVFMRIVRSLLNFICYKGGDQIALFIAEQGPECFQSKREDIQQCINSTFSGYVPKEGIENIKMLPKFILEQKQCDEIARLEKCVVEKLEKCKEITPANIVESMFRFVKNETICRTTTKSQSLKSAAAASVSSIMMIILTAFFGGIAKHCWQ